MSARGIIVGNICTDFKTIGKGESKGISFSVACKDGKMTEYISCVAWNPLAAHIEKYTSKGSTVELVGRIKINDYVNEDGVKFKNTYVLIDNVEFLSKNRNPQQLDFSEVNENE